MNIQLIYAHTNQASTFDDSLFSIQELNKERGYHKIQDRQRHRVAHGLKRTVLAHITQQPSQQLTFTSNRYGKPQLTNPTWHFNVSHSGTWAIIAISAIAPVGVDLEVPKPNLDAADIQPQLSHPKDPDIHTINDLYTHWVIKEAIVKAQGQGLQTELNRIPIHLHTRNTPDSTTFTGQHPDGQQYNGQLLHLPDNTPVAVATVHPTLSVSIQQHPLW